MQGICRLSWMPLRAKPESAAEMVSSLLYGESYKVVDNQGDWLEILTDFDGYKGFISNDQFCEANIDDTQRKIIVQKAFVSTHHPDLPPIIPGGAVLNLYESNLINLINRENTTISLADAVIDTAQLFLGTPYLWGGRCFAGIDCSGFTQIVFKMNGISLPRDSRPQSSFCEPVSFEEIKKADLLFFGKTIEKITHVGIYMGDSKIIHASGKVKINELTKDGIVNESGVLSHLRISAGRVIH